MGAQVPKVQHSGGPEGVHTAGTSIFQQGTGGMVRFVLKSITHPNQRRLPGGEGPGGTGGTGGSRHDRSEDMGRCAGSRPSKGRGRWGAAAAGSLLGQGSGLLAQPAWGPGPVRTQPTRLSPPRPVPAVQMTATRWRTDLTDVWTASLAEGPPHPGRGGR